jgi:signal transduction histidine kinase
MVALPSRIAPADVARMTSLAQRVTVAFAAFVMAGSVALVLWLGAEERRKSRESFVEVARTNAHFIRAQNLPLTERTAKALSDVLGVTVQFYRPASTPMWIPGDRFALDPKLSGPDDQPYPIEIRPGFQTIAGFWELAVAEAQPGGWLVLLRKGERGMVHSRTLVALGVFWALSIALAWVLARGIVRPLRALAERLPRIADESNGPPGPENERQDEIGQLARAYANTHAQLVSERRARAQSERLATLGRMATGLAHEINNPVAAIKLHAQLLEAEAGPAHQERVEIIISESGRIESLVSQWMFLARPNPPETAVMDLGELVSSAVKIHAPAAAHANVTITNETADGLFVKADRRRLMQALVNVLTNATHATAARGGTVRISSVRNDGAIELTIRDNGPGFSTNALERATELFFSEKEGGMGIGLNVAAEILRAHGGDLRLANDPSGGAAVTLILAAQTSPPLSTSSP